MRIHFQRPEASTNCTLKSGDVSVTSESDFQIRDLKIVPSDCEATLGRKPRSGATPAIEDNIMAKTSPIQFLKQVKAEGKKITWPSRKETTVSVIGVFIMVFIASVFLYFADQIMAWIVRMIMSLGM